MNLASVCFVNNSIPNYSQSSTSKTVVLQLEKQPHTILVASWQTMIWVLQRDRRDEDMIYKTAALLKAVYVHCLTQTFEIKIYVQYGYFCL
jgi:hypothetical protein